MDCHVCLSSTKFPPCLHIQPLVGVGVGFPRETLSCRAQLNPVSQISSVRGQEWSFLDGASPRCSRRLLTVWFRIPAVGAASSEGPLPGSSPCKRGSRTETLTPGLAGPGKSKPNTIFPVLSREQMLTNAAPKHVPFLRAVSLPWPRISGFSG